jgi:hypothetical protein
MGGMKLNAMLGYNSGDNYPDNSLKIRSGEFIVNH